MKEFAQKGFKNASTDMIIKDAGISKGALFHYFNNKKDLFLFLYDYVMDIILKEILMKLNSDEKDIFIRLKQLLLLKIEILIRHPEMYKFITNAYLEDSQEVKSDIEIRNKGLIAGNQSRIYEDIDTSLFKESVDSERAIEIVTWTIEGFTNRTMERMKKFPVVELDMNELADEMDLYLEMLKTSFYK